MLTKSKYNKYMQELLDILKNESVDSIFVPSWDLVCLRYSDDACCNKKHSVFDNKDEYSDFAENMLKNETTKLENINIYVYKWVNSYWVTLLKNNKKGEDV